MLPLIIDVTSLNVTETSLTRPDTWLEDTGVPADTRVSGIDVVISEVVWALEVSNVVVRDPVRGEEFPKPVTRAIDEPWDVMLLFNPDVEKTGSDLDVEMCTRLGVLLVVFVGFCGIGGDDAESPMLILPVNRVLAKSFDDKLTLVACLSGVRVDCSEEII